METVKIFDTTLRDGEQAPGCTMTRPDKLEVARQLALLGVDIIEAGFPAAGAIESEAVAAIAAEVGSDDGPVIAGLARANLKDIDACGKAIANASHRRIHTFLATSDLHMEHKLRMTRDQVLQRIDASVRHARSYVTDVEFSPEDASRSDPDFLELALTVAIEAGATTLNIPDTVGYAMPEEYGALIARVARLASKTPGIVISTHCHDDLGLAVANSLAGVQNGARQIECTVNGIGERAGNASLEEVVMALHTRAPVFQKKTRVNTRELTRTSRLVSRATGVSVPPNKAVVGANAFAHESGIHQDGMLKHQQTYEIMTPESVGAEGTKLVLGKHSGRNALRNRLESLGHSVTDELMVTLFERFKEMSDTIKEIGDDMLNELIRGPAGSASAPSAKPDVARPRTLFDKIWEGHIVRPATPAVPAVLYIDLHLVHEVTSAQAFSELRRRGLKLRRPHQTVATMDHSTPTTGHGAPGFLPVIDQQGRAQLEQLMANCAEFGVPLYPLGHEHQGIVHVIGPELGLTQPGMTIVCGDSHTSTHGAFGTLAFGIGTSQVAQVMASQCLLQQRPKTMQIRVEGKLRPGVSAKDIILAIIAKIGVGGGTGHVIEYTGSAIRSLSMEERMTICNMSIEAGARAGMIAADETTFEYLKGRPHAPKGAAWDAAVERWSALRSDEGAEYDTTIEFDANTLEPMITFGTNPSMGISIGGQVPDPAQMTDKGDRAALEQALAYMALAPGKPLAGTPIDVVFLGSCTNSRLSDLRAAAQVIRGKHVAPNTRMMVVPGSREVKKAAEAEGLDKIFQDAGAEWRDPGCSMCLGMNGDILRPGQLSVSTSNRNFEGRQGPGGRTLLASPVTAAACAITGVVTDPRTFMNGANR